MPDRVESLLAVAIVLGAAGLVAWAIRSRGRYAGPGPGSSTEPNSQGAARQEHEPSQHGAPGDLLAPRSQILPNAPMRTQPKFQRLSESCSS